LNPNTVLPPPSPLLPFPSFFIDSYMPSFATRNSAGEPTVFPDETGFISVRLEWGFLFLGVAAQLLVFFLPFFLKVDPVVE